MLVPIVQGPVAYIEDSRDRHPLTDEVLREVSIFSVRVPGVALGCWRRGDSQNSGYPTHTAPPPVLEPLRARKWGRRMSVRRNSGPTKLMPRHHIRPLLRTHVRTVKLLEVGGSRATA